MADQVFGAQHQAIVNWLNGDWWRKGPPLAVIQGFPGVGKTEIARQAMADFHRDSPQVPLVLVDCPESIVSLVDDLVLRLLEALDTEGDSELIDCIDGSGSYDTFFRKLLARPRFIVIDEAQRLMRQADGAVQDGVAQLLESLSRTANARGRLLLLSSREFPRSRWTERAEVNTVLPFRQREAEAYLREHLKRKGRADAVPAERVSDVVAWLGGNARALQLLIHALSRDDLDFLIGLAPQVWEARDRTVSPELLRDFEHEVLVHAEAQLDDKTRLFLRRIAVLRGPFRREALDALATSDIDMVQSRDELLSRYLIEFRSGRYSTHPVIRDTLLGNASEKQRRSAHVTAGHYYAAAFRSRQVVERPEALGARFIEARYHYTLGNAEEDLAFVASRFEAHLRAQFDFTSRIPTERAELDERIGLLSALLKDPGAYGLEYHLARCLLARDTAGDAALALRHLRRSTGPRSPAPAWLLRAQVEHRLHGLDSAMKALREGIRSVPPTQGVFSLYQAAGELLARGGKLQQAVALLNDGIEVVPPTHNLFSLYLAAGEFLVRDGKPDEAVALLRKGMQAVPPTQGLCSLYQAASEFLARDSQLQDAMSLLQEGIKVVPPAHGLLSLYQLMAELLSRRGDVDEAMALLREGITRIGRGTAGYKLAENAILLALDYGAIESLHAFPMGRMQELLLGVVAEYHRGNYEAAADALDSAVEGRSYFTLHVQRGIAALAAGDVKRARTILAGWPGELRLEPDTSVTWFQALIEFLDGNVDTARHYLEIYTGGRRSFATIGLEDFVNLWTESCREIGSPLSYHFPRLPARLFNLDRMLVRHEVVLGTEARGAASDPPRPDVHEEETLAAGAEPVRKRDTVLTVATEWSSEHGGLSTFNRQLCIALGQAGLQVICLVLDATEAEKTEAARQNVRLVEARRGVGLDGAQRLSRKPPGLENFSPDFIIGHGRITGPAAAVLATDHYPAARRLHFVHMAPDEIEPYKSERTDSASLRAERRTELEEDLGTTAHRVVAVGPRLHGRYSTYLAGYPDVPPPLRFDPGFDIGDARPRVPPTGDPWHVLLLGRAEDWVLKGLDLAAAALAKVVKERSPDRVRLEFVVRGAQPETADELRRRLLDEGGIGDRFSPVVRSFATGERLQVDLRRASLVLMPSKTEGFGLVGVEAIVAGTPVLVSRESGLGQLLNETLDPEQAARMVVAMDGEFRQLVDRWASAIDRVLADRTASFQRAEQVRMALAAAIHWRDSVEKLLAELRS